MRLRLFIFFLFISTGLDGYSQPLFEYQTRIIFDLDRTELNDSTQDWLSQCDGLKFRIGKNRITGRSGIRFSNQDIDARIIFNKLSSFLKTNPDRTIVLFIEPEIPWEQIRLNLEESGLINLVAIKNGEGSLPSLSQVLSDKKQILIFTLKESKSLPEWVFYYWDHGFQLKTTLNTPTLFNDVEKGDYRSDLLLIEFFSQSEIFKDLQKRHISSGWSEWQFILNYMIDTWQQNGKKINFFVTDPASGITRVNISLINSFKIVSGKVLHNLRPLDFVIWEGEEKRYTSGVFSFPFLSDKVISLKPFSPGLEFSPSSLQVSGADSNDSIIFFSKPVNIKEKLKLYFPFSQNALDYSGFRIKARSYNLIFKSDEQRGSVASFGHRRWICLPPADQLKIVQSDFTLAVWLKIDSLNSEQSILGTYTQDLRGSIHLSLRDNVPYFGFFGNDQSGKKQLVPGQWYHLVWRYMKYTGEQAIYVDGELDSRSLNHQAYEGADSLYIGRTTLRGGRYFIGKMSEFALWNRALSDSEIWLLAKDISPIKPSPTLYYRYLGAAFLLLFIVFIVLWIFRRRRIKLIHGLNLASDSETQINVESVVKIPDRNVTIKLFGSFIVTDPSGKDRVSDLSPKIRELLLVLLLYSHKHPEGISTEELTTVLWPGFSNKKAANNRNVSVYKLRLLLKDLPGMELSFHDNFWKIDLNELIDFDYRDCFILLKSLSDSLNQDSEILISFYTLISRGRLLPKDQFAWLDSFKERVDSEIIGLISFIIENNHQNFSKQELTNWVDLLMLFDPVNEEMIEILMKTLNDRILAKRYYNKFLEEYKLHYGEKYPGSFSGLFD